MPTNITDANTFTDPVSVPEPGDDRTASSVQVPFQALANRTRYLKGITDALYPGNHTWSGDNYFTGVLALGPGKEVTYSEPRLFTRSVFPLVQSGWDNAISINEGILTQLPSKAWRHVLPLPVGATLTSIAMNARQQSGIGGAGTNLRMYVNRVTPVAGEENTFSFSGPWEVPTQNDWYAVSSGALALTSTEDSVLVLEVRSADNAGVGAPSSLASIVYVYQTSVATRA